MSEPLRLRHWALGLLASVLLHGGAMWLWLPEPGPHSGASGNGASGPLQLRLLSAHPASSDQGEAIASSHETAVAAHSPATAETRQTEAEPAIQPDSHSDSHPDPVAPRPTVRTRSAAAVEASDASQRDVATPRVSHADSPESAPATVAGPTLPSVAVAAGAMASQPTSGSGDGTNRAPDSGAGQASARYTDGIANRVRSALLYPRRARRSGVSGNALVALRIDRAGELQWCKIERSSGSLLLDRDACTTVLRAAPFGAAPSSFAEHELEFTIPVEYDLVRR